MAKRGCMSNYFLISILLVFFMLLYVYASTTLVASRREPFVESTNALISPDKLVVVQGLGVPDVPIAPSMPDPNDSSAPTVDGTENGPRSKFLFAYNACRLDCCPTSGGYSCSGGCPCMTPEQKKFAGSRGFNSRPSKCSYDEKDF